MRPVKLLFIGDIVGKPGRKAVRYFLPRLRKSLGIDFVVANGENMAGGSGITPATASEVFEAGVDVMTSGDHLWDQREVEPLLESEPRFVRPQNYPEGTPGQGFCVARKEGLPPVGVLNLQGQTFMKPIDNPFFAAADRPSCGTAYVTPTAKTAARTARKQRIEKGMRNAGNPDTQAPSFHDRSLCRP